MPLYAFALPLEPLRVGDAIPRERWPRHVTLVGNAVIADGLMDRTIGVVRAFAARTAPITAVVGDEALFGPRQDILVDLVQGRGLAAAHEALLTDLEGWVDARPVDPDHSRGGYRPHVAVRPWARPPAGAPIRLPELCVAQLDPPGIAGLAVPLARFEHGARPIDEAHDADVIRVLDRLDAAGGEHWVVGGWGVDALLGEQTRPHHDLDVLVRVDDVAAVIAAVEAAGVIRSVWQENRWIGGGDRLLPTAFIAELDGLELDVHAVGVGDADVAPTALAGRGTIGGRTVRCFTAAAQFDAHTGYEVPEHQRRDLARLRALAG